MGQNSDIFFNHSIKSVIAAMLIGFVSLIMGAFILTGEVITNGLIQSDLVQPMQNYLFYSRFLIISELLMVLAFSLISILIIIVYKHIIAKNTLLISLGILRSLFLILLLGFFWSPGWEQILNPHGGFKASILLVILGFGQSFALIYGGIRD